MRYICNKHKDKGELTITEHHFYEGKGCTYCGRERTNESRKSKWTDEDDKQLCESKSFEYVKTEKVNGKYCIFFICPKHSDIGIQYMQRGNMNRECVHGCQYCIGRNIPEWYAKKHILESFNIEVLSEFKGTDSTITCKCLKHDKIFTADSGSVFYSGLGCPDCAFERRSEAYRLSGDEVIKRIYQHGNNITIMNIEDYRNVDTKLRVHCNNCGYEWESPVHSMFISGAPCPSCTDGSHGERKIMQVLDDKNINHRMQYVIEDCKDVRALPFDDSILDKDDNLLGLIEYMGEQHYRSVEHFGGIDKFEYTVSHDKIKKDYCEQHNIPLLIIPYWDYDNIEDLLDDFIKSLNVL